MKSAGCLRSSGEVDEDRRSHRLCIRSGYAEWQQLRVEIIALPYHDARVAASLAGILEALSEQAAAPNIHFTPVYDRSRTIDFRNPQAVSVRQFPGPKTVSALGPTRPGSISRPARLLQSRYHP